MENIERALLLRWFTDFFFTLVSFATAALLFFVEKKEMCGCNCKKSPCALPPPLPPQYVVKMLVTMKKS